MKNLGHVKIVAIPEAPDQCSSGTIHFSGVRRKEHADINNIQLTLPFKGECLQIKLLPKYNPHNFLVGHTHCFKEQVPHGESFVMGFVVVLLPRVVPEHKQPVSSPNGLNR